MKERVIVGFNFTSDKWPNASSLFKAIGREDLAQEPEREFGYTFKFDPEGYAKFLEEASHFGFSEKDMFVTRKRIFSTKDLLAAELLCFMTSTAPRGYSGSDLGNTYDFSLACPKCGTGAKQVPPLIFKLDGARVGKLKIFITLDSDILISPFLADYLQKNRVTGLELGEVVSFRGKQKLPWLQIRVANQLPSMAPSSRGITRENSCSVCDRDGYFITLEEPTEIHYHRKELTNVFDFNISRELYGNSGVRDFRYFARPKIIVKPKVLQLFLEQGIKGVHFTPVYIDD